jgi:antitoxin MazE
MKIKIAKWGNSLALRLPKRYADELGLKPGSTVDIEKDGAKLAIDTAPQRKIPRYTLEGLLAQIKPGSALRDWDPAVRVAVEISDIALGRGMGDLEELAEVNQGAVRSAESQPDALEPAIFWLDWLAGRSGRPAGDRHLVSPRVYNQQSSLILVCPITRNTDAWAFKSRCRRQRTFREQLSWTRSTDRRRVECVDPVDCVCGTRGLLGTGFQLTISALQHARQGKFHACLRSRRLN